MATDFSRTLSLLRQEKGISQRKAAAALGISQALLSHYENGIREPGLAFVCKVCDFYRVSADFLLGRTANRDGAMIDSEMLYDGSTEKGSLRGSIMATLQKKLAVNTTGLLFDLLSRTNSREAITAAGDCLGATLYDLLRRLYRQSGGNEDLFATEAVDFDAGAVDAALLRSRGAYMRALTEADELPHLSSDALTTLPGMHLYTANYLAPQTACKDDAHYEARDAVCFETEDFPDAPNHPDFPDTTLLPDAPYSSTTIYRFDIAPM